MGARSEALGLLALPFALAPLAGPPSLAPVSAAIEAGQANPSAPVVAVLGLLAWLCCGWLLLLVGLEAAAGVSRPLDRLARQVAPASVRGLVRVALGATAASVLVVTPALAQTAQPTPAPAPTRAAPTLFLDWPGTPASAPPAVATSHRPPASPTVASTQLVVVRPGDSLWEIAADHLPGSATPRQIAVAWPKWWHANRAVIGPNPDVIVPGTVLHAPVPTRGEP